MKQTRERIIAFIVNGRCEPEISAKRLIVTARTLLAAQWRGNEVISDGRPDF